MTDIMLWVFFWAVAAAVTVIVVLVILVGGLRFLRKMIQKELQARPVDENPTHKSRTANDPGTGPDQRDH